MSTGTWCIARSPCVAILSCGIVGSRFWTVEMPRQAGCPGDRTPHVRLGPRQRRSGVQC